MLSEPRAETLLKSGQIELFKEFYRHEGKIKKYWNSIKICIRNGYIINEPDIWLDQIDLLSYFRKDLHSVKYVCFKDHDDLHQQHNRLTSKKRAILEKQAYEERKKIMKKENVDYKAARGMFFGLRFASREITVKILESIQEIYQEGQELNHCIYTGAYYKKEKSLLLSARKGETILETIEIDLQKMEIIQARGIRNQSTQYHSQIVELVERNIDQIRNIRDGKKKQGKSRVMHSQKQDIAV